MSASVANSMIQAILLVFEHVIAVVPHTLPHMIRQGGTNEQRVGQRVRRRRKHDFTFLDFRLRLFVYPLRLFFPHVLFGLRQFLPLRERQTPSRKIQNSQKRRNVKLGKQ